jgi:predicted transglutaminase-like cysteine proteinase
MGLNKKTPSDADLVRAIYWWVKNRVKFREDGDILTREMEWRDPYQELLISPEILIGMPQAQGDCDDFSMLLAALLVAARIPVWFVAVAVDEREPWRWSHIYCKVFLKDEGRFVTLDASHGKFPGWETERTKYRVMKWRVN